MRLTELPTPILTVANQAMQAMNEGKILDLTYHGENRHVEVHCVGLTSKGKPALRVFQIAPLVEGVQGGEWKMLSIEKIEDCQVLNMPSQGPRPGFKPNDTGMGTIFAEISNEAVPDEPPPS